MIQREPSILRGKAVDLLRQLGLEHGPAVLQARILQLTHRYTYNILRSTFTLNSMYRDDSILVVKWLIQMTK